MSKLIWNENNLPNLGRIFLSEVIRNMREKATDGATTVRFGLTGKGERPNYQTTFPNGLIRAVNGASHNTFDRTDFNEEEFDTFNLSQPFTLAQVKKAYEDSVSIPRDSAPE